jgi:outer membrane protein W
MRKIAGFFIFFALSAAASGQSFEGAISMGASRIPDGKIGLSDGVPITLTSGGRLTFRMTVNTTRFTGFEFGYAHNRTTLGLAGARGQGMAIHQPFGEYLLYALPEGSRIRPFVAGGFNFSTFVQPGATIMWGGGDLQVGINYGAGIKVRVAERWLVRMDFRQFNTGKPFNFPGRTGRFIQNEISLGIGYAR